MLKVDFYFFTTLEYTKLKSCLFFVLEQTRPKARCMANETYILPLNCLCVYQYVYVSAYAYATEKHRKKFTSYK